MNAFQSTAAFFNRPELTSPLRQKNRGLLHSLAFGRMQRTESMKSLKRSVSGRWENKAAIPECQLCSRAFGLLRRPHVCKECGEVVCGPCSSHTKEFPALGYAGPVRVCDRCFTLPSKEEISRQQAAMAVSEELDAATAKKRPQDGVGAGTGLSSVSQSKVAAVLQLTSDEDQPPRQVIASIGGAPPSSSEVPGPVSPPTSGVDEKQQQPTQAAATNEEARRARSGSRSSSTHQRRKSSGASGGPQQPQQQQRQQQGEAGERRLQRVARKGSAASGGPPEGYYGGHSTDDEAGAASAMLARRRSDAKPAAAAPQPSAAPAGAAVSNSDVPAPAQVVGPRRRRGSSDASVADSDIDVIVAGLRKTLRKKEFVAVEPSRSASAGDGGKKSSNKRGRRRKETGREDNSKSTATVSFVEQKKEPQDGAPLNAAANDKPSAPSGDDHAGWGGEVKDSDGSETQSYHGSSSDAGRARDVVSDGGSSDISGDGSRHSRDHESDNGGEKQPVDPALAAAAAAAEAESIAALQRFGRLNGRYALSLSFVKVIQGEGPTAAPVAYARQFKALGSAAGVKGHKVLSAAKKGAAGVKAGTRLTLQLTMRPAGDSKFIRGHIEDGGPFGPVSAAAAHDDAKRRRWVQSHLISAFVTECWPVAILDCLPLLACLLPPFFLLQDGWLRACAQLCDGTILAVVDFKVLPMGAQAHQFKLTGLVRDKC